MKKISVLILLLAACSSDSNEDNNGNNNDNNMGIVIDFDQDKSDSTDGSDMGTNPSDSGTDTTDTGPTPDSGSLIGDGDGTVDSVTFTEILAANNLQTTDLEFNPENDEQLWLVQRQSLSNSPCTETVRTGCGALIGFATIITNPGEANQTNDRREDGNAWHFLRRPSSMAFGQPGVWASCSDARTGNFTDANVDYMGPSLWSSDLDVFAKDPGVDSNGRPLNGSHLDMLHETPFCMGIAHEVDNVFWAFNGNVGSIDKIDFAADHGAGYHDHSDGKVYRYAIGELLRVPHLPSGMHFDSNTNLLYVVDTGNKRIISMDTKSGERAGAIEPIYEQLADNAVFNNAKVEEVVKAGALEKPSGMLIHEDTIYVSDNATGKIHAFDFEGKELRQLQTPFDDGDLSAITLGPDGKIYIASLKDSTVLRIDL